MSVYRKEINEHESLFLFLNSNTDTAQIIWIPPKGALAALIKI